MKNIILLIAALTLCLSNFAKAQDVAIQGLEVSTTSIIDSDKDGIALEFDQCLSTPYGAQVDSKGCMVCPAGYQMDEYGCFQMQEEAVTIPVNVNFATNETVLGSDDLADLDAIRQQLQNLEVESVAVSGHTDAVGSNNYNDSLSNERAQTVARTIQTLGIKARTVEVSAHGEQAPLADNESERGREINRRVEAVIKARRELKKYKTNED